MLLLQTESLIFFLSAKDRLDKTKKSKLCTNCLSRATHQLVQCPRCGCKYCGNKHKSILHQGVIQNMQSPVVNLQTQLTTEDTDDSSKQSAS